MIESPKLPAMTARSAKSALIQFRVDEPFMKQMNSVAARLNTPPGVLARAWVAERLAQELRVDVDLVRQWQKARLSVIQANEIKGEFIEGPIIIIHIMPLTTGITIEPERLKTFSTSYAPQERIEERYAGRITRLGFETRQVRESDDRKAAYVQAFFTGQIESVRVLPSDNPHRAIDAAVLDDDLIRAIWSYCIPLAALRIPLPLLISISAMDVKDYWFKTAAWAAPQISITEDAFTLHDVQITGWEQVETIEATANTLKCNLDEFWHAAGYDRSYSFDIRGRWLGLINRLKQCRR